MTKSCQRGGRRSRRRRSLSKRHPIQQAMSMAQGQTQGQGQGMTGGGLTPLAYSKVGADMGQGGAGAYEIATVGGNYDQQAGYFDANAFRGIDAASQAVGQTGGRRYRRRGSRRRGRGGNFGSVLSNAVVPFTLLAAQNAYGRRRMTKLMRGPQRLVRGTRRILKF